MTHRATLSNTAPPHLHHHLMPPRWPISQRHCHACQHSHRCGPPCTRLRSHPAMQPVHHHPRDRHLLNYPPPTPPSNPATMPRAKASQVGTAAAPKAASKKAASKKAAASKAAAPKKAAAKPRVLKRVPKGADDKRSHIARVVGAFEGQPTTIMRTMLAARGALGTGNDEAANKLLHNMRRVLPVSKVKYLLAAGAGVPKKNSGVHEASVMHVTELFTAVVQRLKHYVFQKRRAVFKKNAKGAYVRQTTVNLGGNKKPGTVGATTSNVRLDGGTMANAIQTVFQGTGMYLMGLSEFVRRAERKTPKKPLTEAQLAKRAQAQAARQQRVLDEKAAKAEKREAKMEKLLQQQKDGKKVRVNNNNQPIGPARNVSNVMRRNLLNAVTKLQSDLLFGRAASGMTWKQRTNRLLPPPNPLAEVLREALTAAIPARMNGTNEAKVVLSRNAVMALRHAIPAWLIALYQRCAVQGAGMFSGRISLTPQQLANESLLTHASTM